MEIECNVCLSKFNGNNKKVNCFCDYHYCVKCAKKYFNEVNEIKCMNCNIEFSRSFLVKNFGKTFINKEYKIYRQNKLFKLEEKMFKETQLHIEKDNKLIDLNKLINQKKQEIKNIQKIIYDIRREENIKLNAKIEELKNLTAKTIELKTYNELKTLHEYNSQLNELNQDYEFIYKTRINSFILPTNIKCRNNDCYGNLNENFYCNLCKKQSCDICYDVKEEDFGQSVQEHICNKEKIQTIEYIKKNLQVKPCPNCNIDISLTEGCHDMFCSKCKTTFNFKTLKITKGNTNEAYKKYVSELKQVSINEHSIICPSELDDNYLQLIKTSELNYDFEFDEYKKQIINFYYSIIDIKNVVRREYTNLSSPFNRTLNLRKFYMKKKISLEEFKIEIQKIDKDYSKREEIGDILTTYTECSSDILNCFMIEYTQKIKDISEYITDIQTALINIYKLITITNDAFIDISNIYNCKVYCINYENFNFN